jgi:hypothetical protein
MQRCIAALLAVSLASLLALPLTPAHACLNDRASDSLAAEGRALPDVIQVIVGRFDLWRRFWRGKSRGVHPPI